MDDMMQHEELKERIDKLAQLMADPQPGLFTYQMAVGNMMQALCDRWTQKPVQTKGSTQWTAK